MPRYFKNKLIKKENLMILPDPVSSKLCRLLAGPSRVGESSEFRGICSDRKASRPDRRVCPPSRSFWGYPGLPPDSDTSEATTRTRFRLFRIGLWIGSFLEPWSLTTASKRSSLSGRRQSPRREWRPPKPRGGFGPWWWRRRRWTRDFFKKPTERI